MEGTAPHAFTVMEEFSVCSVSRPWEKAEAGVEV